MFKESADKERQETTERFEKGEKSIADKATKSSSAEDAGEGTSSGGAKKKTAGLPSFWVPNLTPHSKAETRLPRPDKTVYCPMSGKPLRLKDLVDVKFTPIDKDSKDVKDIIAREER